MGRILRLGLISIMLICVIAGLVSASVTLAGPTTVTRGGVSDGEPNVDGYFNLTVNGNDTTSAPMHLGLIINPQTMTGDICDRPPFLINDSRRDFILGQNDMVWPNDPLNSFNFDQVSPNGVDAPSVGCWLVPWDGTHYYGRINTNSTIVKVGTLYTGDYLPTSLKAGEYRYHLQTDNGARSVPGVDSTDLNVTITYGQVTAGAYDFAAWSQGSLVPVSTISSGHTVMLQGVNTDSQTTYLYLAGEGLPECGVPLNDGNPLVVQSNPDIQTGGAYLNGTWFFPWRDEYCLGGAYTIYASSVNPADLTNQANVDHLCNNNAGACDLSVCGQGGICGLNNCPTCGPEPAIITITVTKPDFSFTVPEIIDRCCCAVFPCGSADPLTDINLTGQTGVPGTPIQVWLFGNSWIGDKAYLVGTFTSLLDEKGTFTLDLRELLNEEDINLCELAAGEYNVIVQVPGCGSTTFDVGTEYIPGELVGYDAYKALRNKLKDNGPSLCLNCPPVHDQYIHLRFSIRDVCNGGSVDFTGTPKSGYPPMSVQFTDASTFVGTSWSWDFGDNFTSTEKNPVHEYTLGGSYDVTLKVTNGTTTKEQTKLEYIEVLIPEPTYDLPQANFTYVAKTADPMTIQFIDQSYGATNLTYLWSFGDGATSTDKVPAHTYGAVGTYAVTLTVTDGYSKTSTVTQSIEVPAKPSGLPEISFTADVTEGTYPLTVQFLDTTVTTWADSWQWNFGDGATSSLRSPVHTYTTPGLYTVTLRASNVNGEGSEMTIPDYIKVQHSAPVITAKADPMSGTFPLRVEFTASATVDNKTVDQSAALIQSWLWDFGDGSISSEQNPVHVYEKPGSYQVTVMCTLYDGVNNSLDVGTIEVGPIPYANFYWEYLDKDETCCYLVKFTDTSYGAASWLWDFGDGMTSDEQNPTHRYKEVGYYNVTLTVDDGSGNTDVMTQTVQITSGYTTPTPTPTPIPVPGAVKAIFYSTAIGTRTIEFTDQSTGLIEGSSTWLWDFGDDTHSSEQNPTHLYPKDGEYTVIFKVDNGKFSDSVTQTIGVR